MLQTPTRHAALSTTHRMYEVFLQMVGDPAIGMDLCSLVTLCMVNKQCRETVSDFMVALKQKKIFFSKAKRRLLLFNANGEHITMGHIHRDIFKIRAHGMDYVVTKDDHSTLFFDSMENFLFPDMQLNMVFDRLLDALDVASDSSLRSQISDAKIWIDKSDDQDTFNIYVDFPQMDLMADARKTFEELNRKNPRPGFGDGVHLRISLRGIRFD